MSLGVHVIADLCSCDAGLLNDPVFIEKMLKDATKAAGATEIRTIVHTFNPVGVTGVTVLAESHISIHTWPEKGVATVDAFTCGKTDPQKAIDFICLALKGVYSERYTLLRVPNESFETSAHLS